jgi:hypothetical protein
MIGTTHIARSTVSSFLCPASIGVDFGFETGISTKSTVKNYIKLLFLSH